MRQSVRLCTAYLKSHRIRITRVSKSKPSSLSGSGMRHKMEWTVSSHSASQTQLPALTTQNEVWRRWYSRMKMKIFSSSKRKRTVKTMWLASWNSTKMKRIKRKERRGIFTHSATLSLQSQSLVSSIWASWTTGTLSKDSIGAKKKISKSTLKKRSKKKTSHISSDW